MRARATRSLLQRRQVQMSVLMIAIIGTVIIGLLAMHTIQTPVHLNASASISSAASQNDAAHSEAAYEIVACVNACMPTMTMSAMNCPLAITPTEPMGTHQVSQLGVLTSRDALRAITLSVGLVHREHPPPDLVFLSVSRT
jgi:hypothetical protein